jgi:putative ATP-dependent endonuclease of OLD family
LTRTISAFITDVQDITLESESRIRRALRTSTRVLVNDGVKTDLQLKGDGIISLTAISLLRHISQGALGQKSLILAIEEPESHLHPRAVHGLRKVLLEIAQKHQVLISTHSQALVDRQTVGNNIIVERRTATPATDFAAVRISLGLELSDNLSSAYLVLLTEGHEDGVLLQLWLSAISTRVNESIRSGLLAFDDLGGANNLSYKASFYRNTLCNIHAFLDNDDDGRRATEKAITKDVITPTDYNLCVCKGMHDSEIEDLIDPETSE